MNRKKEFEDLVDSIGVAMMTTRCSDGQLRSRAMANQKRTAGADLWFVTSAGAEKLKDLEGDPHINLSYYKDGSREWASVSGIARVSHDRAKIHELYASDWKMWFTSKEQVSDPMAGTVHDPDITLIGVNIQRVTFFAVDRAGPVVLYEMAKGWLSGTAPDLGEVKSFGSS